MGTPSFPTFDPLNDAALREFVKQSQLIEGELTRGIRFDTHLNLAWKIARLSFVDDPRSIHQTLMAPEPEKFPGELRQYRVTVGGRPCPDPVRVRPLFGSLMRRVRLLESPTSDAIWALHHELEAIHPFIDGNGRTGRLWLNNLRSVFGLPWVRIPYVDRFTYYDEIERWIRESDWKES